MPITYLPGGYIDAAAHGVIPGIDATVPFQNLLAMRDRCAPILLDGGLTFTAPVEAMVGTGPGGKPPGLWLIGKGCDTACGTSITGNFAGPLLVWNQAGTNSTTSIHIEGIRFSNFHPQGIGLQLEGVNGGYIDNCVFGPAWRGIIVGQLHQTNVDLSLSNIILNGSLQQHGVGSGSIGAAINAQAVFFNVSGYQWEHSACLFHREVSIYRGHFEVNRAALRIGLKPDLTPGPISGVYSHLTMEANVAPVVLEKDAEHVVFECLKIHGTANSAGLGNPDYGVDYKPGSRELNIHSAQVHGNFNLGGIRLAGDGPAVLLNCDSGAGAAPDWVITMPDLTKLTEFQCNIPP